MLPKLFCYENVKPQPIPSLQLVSTHDSVHISLLSRSTMGSGHILLQNWSHAMKHPIQSCAKAAPPIATDTTAETIIALCITPCFPGLFKQRRFRYPIPTFFAIYDRIWSSRQTQTCLRPVWSRFPLAAVPLLECRRNTRMAKSRVSPLSGEVQGLGTVRPHQGDGASARKKTGGAIGTAVLQSAKA